MEKEVLLKVLGDKIRVIREKKGITQKQLAHTINKEQQSIQRLEAGKINPSIFYLLEVSQGLEVSITELLIFE